MLLAAAEQGYADPRRLPRPARNAGLLHSNAREVVAEYRTKVAGLPVADRIPTDLELVF